MSIIDSFVALAVVGPSGSGKSTLCSRVLSEFTDFRLSVSYTTRAPRGAEQNGVHYHFIEKARFSALIDEGAFLEWAEVHGNYYGTAAHIVEDAREQSAGGVLFDIDHQGARQIRAKLPNLVTVLVVPPSWNELERRLRARATETAESLQKRLNNALGEVTHYGMFDYVLVNDDLIGAERDLIAIVRAERVRRARAAAFVEALLRTKNP